MDVIQGIQFVRCVLFLSRRHRRFRVTSRETTTTRRVHPTSRRRKKGENYKNTPKKLPVCLPSFPFVSLLSREEGHLGTGQKIRLNRSNNSTREPAQQKGKRKEQGKRRGKWFHTVFLVIRVLSLFLTSPVLPSSKSPLFLLLCFSFVKIVNTSPLFISVNFFFACMDV